MTKFNLRGKLSYGVADIGAAISTTAINFFLLHFLVECSGLKTRLGR